MNHEHLNRLEREIRSSLIKHHHEYLTKHASDMTISNSLLKLFTQATSRKEYADNVVRLIHQWIDCRCVGIRLLDEEGNIPYESYIGFSHEFWQSENWLSTKKHNCICIRIMTGKPEHQDLPFMTPEGSFYCGNLLKVFSKLRKSNISCFRGACIRNGFNSLAIIPIRNRNKIIGVLHFADEREGKVSLKITEFIENITPIIGEASYRFGIEEELQQNYHKQTVINSLLSLSLKEGSLEDLLKEVLDIILAAPWLSFVSKGGIFLVEDQTLFLKTHRGFSEFMREKCAQVPIRQCLCGQTALSGEIQFSECLDHRHEIHYQGITPHGHYCVPIGLNGSVLGVMTLYLREGQPRDNKIEKFLTTVAFTLAGIIDRKRSEENLRAARQQLMDIIDFLPNATFVVDQHKRVIAWNHAIEEMTGVNKEKMIGKGDYVYAIPFYGFPRPMLVDLIFSQSKEPEEKYDHIERKGNAFIAEVYLPLAFDRREIYLWASASPLFDGKGNMVGAIQTIRDITKRKKMQNQLQYLASHDFLTNIPNRYSLEENLRRVVAKAKRGVVTALLFIDLDNFKLVNDTLGHSAGDELLIVLANILKSNLRETDLIFRFGGDEFAILLEGATVEEARIVAEKLRRVVDESELCLAMRSTCFNLSISIGIVMVDGIFDTQKLLSYADTALYSAKEAGRNRVVVLQPDNTITERLSETNRLVSLVKNALKYDRFILYFQPIIDMRDGRVVHYETLIRLREESGEIILPGTFIPIAERFGLISQIDRWVVLASIKALREYKELKLFINISGASLGDESLLDLIENNIRTCGLNPQRIGFEITETAAVKDLMRAERWVRRIKSLGCSFALDDFGIGFSSFSYLRMLPVDYLKLDGTFVRNLNSDPTQRNLVQAMNVVAQALGKKTIAEFVENEGIVRSLKEMGIDYGQGYHLGKPSPVPQWQQ